MVRNIIKIVIAVLICCIMLFGCSTEVSSTKDVNRFDIVDANSGCEIIVDKETGVMYLSYYSYNGNGLTLMVDADGNPLIYKED